jgi:hypothetical protein
MIANPNLNTNTIYSANKNLQSVFDFLLALQTDFALFDPALLA